MAEKRKNHEIKGSKFWWLPGTLAALASIGRFAYEVFRDHIIR
ncbi:hypothetical protein ABT294_40175 [Nonomuraea sp. NPDC000554]